MRAIFLNEKEYILIVFCRRRFVCVFNVQRMIEILTAAAPPGLVNTSPDDGKASKALRTELEGLETRGGAAGGRRESGVKSCNFFFISFFFALTANNLYSEYLFFYTYPPFFPRDIILYTKLTQKRETRGRARSRVNIVYIYINLSRFFFSFSIHTDYQNTHTREVSSN